MSSYNRTPYLRIKERRWRGPYLDIRLVWSPADGSYDLAPDTLLKNRIVELPFYDTTIPCPIEYQKTLFDRFGGECLKKDAWGRSVAPVQRKRLDANRLRREGLATPRI